MLSMSLPATTVDIDCSSKMVNCTQQSLLMSETQQHATEANMLYVIAKPFVTLCGLLHLQPFSQTRMFERIQQDILRKPSPWLQLAQPSMLIAHTW